jgi:hypothetical protein
MSVVNMLQKIVPSGSAFEMTAGPFTVEFRIYSSSMFDLVPIKVAS